MGVVASGARPNIQVRAPRPLPPQQRRGPAAARAVRIPLSRHLVRIPGLCDDVLGDGAAVSREHRPIQSYPEAGRLYPPRPGPPDGPRSPPGGGRRCFPVFCEGWPSCGGRARLRLPRAREAPRRPVEHRPRTPAAARVRADRPTQRAQRAQVSAGGTDRRTRRARHDRAPARSASAREATCPRGQVMPGTGGDDTAPIGTRHCPFPPRRGVRPSARGVRRAPTAVTDGGGPFSLTSEHVTRHAYRAGARPCASTGQVIHNLGIAFSPPDPPHARWVQGAGRRGRASFRNLEAAMSPSPLPLRPRGPRARPVSAPRCHRARAGRPPGAGAAPGGRRTRPGRPLTGPPPTGLRERGMSTAEYAVGTVTACAFAAVLFAVLNSAEVRDTLLGIVTDALRSGG